jgi:hypothetical protein
VSTLRLTFHKTQTKIVQVYTWLYTVQPTLIYGAKITRTEIIKILLRDVYGKPFTHIYIYSIAIVNIASFDLCPVYSVPILLFTHYHSLALTASLKPGVSTIVNRSLTPFSSISMYFFSMPTVFEILSGIIRKWWLIYIGLIRCSSDRVKLKEILKSKK